MGCTSPVTVSDDRSHSRDCVIVFLEHLIKQLLNENINSIINNEQHYTYGLMVQAANLKTSK